MGGEDTNQKSEYRFPEYILWIMIKDPGLYSIFQTLLMQCLRQDSVKCEAFFRLLLVASPEVLRFKPIFLVN